MFEGWEAEKTEEAAINQSQHHGMFLMESIADGVRPSPISGLVV